MPKILCTDLDGTLFYPKKHIRMISHKNRKFLRDFIDAGNKVALVSGRTDFVPTKCQKLIDRDLDIIGCNGAFIRANGEVINDVTFDAKFLTTLIADLYKTYDVNAMMIMSKNERLCIDKDNSAPFVRNFYFLYDFAQGCYAENCTLNTKRFYEEVKAGNVYKLMLFFGAGKHIKYSKDVNKKIRETYGDKLEASWCGEVIEISPEGCSKANAVKKYIEYLNIQPENVIVIGDSGNDISMFREFPENSFCMKHAHRSVSKYAKHIVSRVHKIEEYIDIKER